MKYRGFVRDNDAPLNYYYRSILLFLLDAFKEREMYQLEETNFRRLEEIH